MTWYHIHEVRNFFPKVIERMGVAGYIKKFMPDSMQRCRIGKESLAYFSLIIEMTMIPLTVRKTKPACKLKYKSKPNYLLYGGISHGHTFPIILTKIAIFIQN